MVYYRKSFMLCIERIEQVDNQLRQCQITIDNSHTKRLLRMLLVTIMCLALTLAISTALTFNIDPVFPFRALYVPLTMNTISKLWFVAFVEAIRRRFMAINAWLEDMRTSIVIKKRNAQHSMWHKNEPMSLRQRWRRVAVEGIVVPSHGPTNGRGVSRKPRQEFISTEFAEKLNVTATERQTSKFNEVSYVQPAVADHDMNIYTDTKRTPSFNSPSLIIQSPTQSKEDTFVHILSMLCFLHDDLCSISKLINQMFSCQMLIVLAYAFAANTTQLYFVYCGLVGQVCSISNYILRIFYAFAIIYAEPKYVFLTEDSAAV